MWPFNCFKKKKTIKNIPSRTIDDLKVLTKVLKIYASFCEMKPIVLKNPTPSFCGLYLRVGNEKRKLRRNFSVPTQFRMYVTSPTRAEVGAI